MGDMPATVAWTVLWPTVVPWLAAAVLPLLLAAWPLRDPRRVRWGATELVAAAAHRAGLGRRGIPRVLVALRMVTLAAIALAAARPFLAPAAPAAGVPLVAGSADRRIEIVVATEPEAAIAGPHDSSLALRRAVAALAAAPSALAERGVPAVDVVAASEAGMACVGRRLIVVCDGALPEADAGRRLAAAIHAGSAVVVCLGPDAAAPLARTRLSDWLRELAGLELEGVVTLEKSAIDAGALIAAGTGSVLVGPAVDAVMAVSCPTPPWTVLAHTAAGGRPLVVEAAVGAGRLCVVTIPLTIAADPTADAWSDLAAWPAFLPFVDRLFSRLLDAAPTDASATAARRFTGFAAARLLLGIAAAAAATEWGLAAYFARPAAVAWASRAALVALCAGMFILWGGHPRPRPAPHGKPPAVAILIDTSPSMATPDATIDGAPLPRLAALQTGFAVDGGRAVRGLSSGRTAVWSASDTTPPQDGTASPSAAIARLATAAPAAHASRLGDGVARLLAAAPPAAIVMATDGAISDGTSWEEIARLLAQRRVPLVAVPVGSDATPAAGSLPTGFRITAVDAPAVGRPDERLTVSIRAAASVPHPQPLPLAAIDGAGSLAPSADTGAAFRYRFQGRCADRVPRDHTDTAMLTRTIRVAGDPGHTATFPLVVTTAPIRVMLVDAAPRFEYRFLERLLAGDERFAVDSCLVAATEFAGLRPTKPLPASVDDWKAYDVVVLGDLPIASAPGSEAASLTALADAARQHGIGIAWCPGSRWARDDAGLVSWMPATLRSGVDHSDRPRRLAVTAAGRREGWFAFLDDRRPDAPPFAPPLFAILDGVALGPTARRMALAADDGGRPADAAIVAARLGAATIVGHFCETWRWRDDDGIDSHAMYWTHLLARLAERHRLARLVDATLTARPCDPVAGETVWVDAVPTRPELSLGGWKIEVAAPGGAQRQFPLSATAAGAAVSLPLADLATGRHAVRLVPPPAAVDAAPSRVAIQLDVVVNEPARELPGGPAGIASLVAVAEASGGAVVPLDRLDTLPATIGRVTSTMQATVAGPGPRWFDSQSFAHLLVAAAVAAGVAAWRPREREPA